jgi:hypothetical protein
LGLLRSAALLLQESHPQSRSPHFPQLRTLRALLWFAARTVVSAQGLFTDTVATAFVAMAMCVEATDIAGAIAAGNSKGLLPFLLAGRKPACVNRITLRTAALLRRL